MLLQASEQLEINQNKTKPPSQKPLPTKPVNLHRN